MMLKENEDFTPVVQDGHLKTREEEKMKNNAFSVVFTFIK